MRRRCFLSVRPAFRASIVPQLVCCFLLPLSAAAQQRVTLEQTPHAVQQGTAQLIGHYNPDQMLRLVFALRPPHMEEEEQFLRDLQDPDSPLFHQYLSEAEWNQRFAPSAEDEAAVVAWAQSQGLTITQRFPNRLLVDVEAPAAVIERALNVSLNSYQIGEESYFSNDRDPSIPASLNGVVHAVLGLNNIEVARSRSGKQQEEAWPVYSPGPTHALGPHLQGDGDPKQLPAAMQAKAGVRQYYSEGAYDPTDLYASTAYNYIALQNLGHCCNPLNHPNNSPPESSIAISIWGDFSDSDYAGFLSYYSYLAHNVQRHFVDGSPHCCEFEPTIDVEWSTAMSNSFGSASKTSEIHLYAAVNNQLSTLLDGLNQILTDGKARVLSMSWGAAENYIFRPSLMDSYHAVFNQMVGQGWTVVAISGDWGSTGDCQHLSAIYPSTDPDVTSVGGTYLSTSQSSYNSEVAWSGGPDGCAPPNNDGGSGGGCSVHFSAPSYQGSTACGSGSRGVPDISLNSDWVFAPQNLYYQGGWWSVGGTSIATPELAGFFAQENAYLLYVQSLVGNTCGSSLSKPCAPVGQANPSLYSEGRHPSAPHYPFYDITSGCNSNDITQQHGLTYYCAGAGYDLVTGWGSANMLQLAWMFNYFLAGDQAGPAATFSGPVTNHWYNTDQTVSWSLADTSGNGHQPIGVAGSSQAWDADPGDPSREAMPGSGSNYYGPQSYGASGSAGGLSMLSQGCHTDYVRAWDNAGNSALSSYGPAVLRFRPSLKYLHRHW